MKVGGRNVCLLNFPRNGEKSTKPYTQKCSYMPRMHRGKTFFQNTAGYNRQLAYSCECTHPFIQGFI